MQLQHDKQRHDWNRDFWAVRLAMAILRAIWWEATACRGYRRWCSELTLWWQVGEMWFRIATSDHKHGIPTLGYRLLLTVLYLPLCYALPWEDGLLLWLLQDLSVQVSKQAHLEWSHKAVPWNIRRCLNLGIPQYLHGWLEQLIHLG